MHPQLIKIKKILINLNLELKFYVILKFLLFLLKKKLLKYFFFFLNWKLDKFIYLLNYLDS